ncbi:uncharacterized protein PFL1_01835 [Pseudozyma flocculosa PF-1]|uniref:Related to DNA damage-responsive protein 48 n=1 Tax=Pseudozyma flocculosa TaxID=84751 RepID=A0A5C3EY28_9BASI|nr:uncharacterized protein PFL1_01835 [Pseudozyma flocculosa PF-1]EPQ30937.1 hypothetical protein PFL1_01835 [Pseudozyma flocculosa PF-1]SPO36675.1 related to DNA damage-responsive protein 48 [Pseudozyma flocculosa]
MDQLNSFLNKQGGGQQQQGGGDPNQQQQQGGGGGGFGGMLNNALGGGQQGEAKEDGLDKAIDGFQQYVLKEGEQNNESAMEQQKDNMIADGIRNQYKSFTGNDFPIKDK